MVADADEQGARSSPRPWPRWRHRVPAVVADCFYGDDEGFVRASGTPGWPSCWRSGHA